MSRIVLIAALIGCGESATTLQSGVPLPGFIVGSCGRDLEGAGARLRISGHTAACPLQIDRDAGQVIGECRDISAGTARTVALEYYVLMDGELVVLAQQVGSVDLAAVEESRVAIVIDPALATRRCVGGLHPKEIDFSVCDRDGDGMENLAEYCHATREPLIAE